MKKLDVDLGIVIKKIKLIYTRIMSNMLRLVLEDGECQGDPWRYIHREIS